MRTIVAGVLFIVIIGWIWAVSSLGKQFKALTQGTPVSDGEVSKLLAAKQKAQQTSEIDALKNEPAGSV